MTKVNSQGFPEHWAPSIPLWSMLHAKTGDPTQASQGFAVIAAGDIAFGCLFSGSLRRQVILDEHRADVAMLPNCKNLLNAPAAAVARSPLDSLLMFRSRAQ